MYLTLKSQGPHHKLSPNIFFKKYDLPSHGEKEIVLCEARIIGGCGYIAFPSEMVYGDINHVMS